MLNLYESTGLATLIAWTPQLLTMPLLDLAILCLDESGKFADTEVVAIAGCIAKSETLASMTRQWYERLGKDGLPHISMKEAMRFDGPFHSWRPETGDITKKRDDLIWDLASIIAAAPMSRITATFKSAEFRQLPSDIQKKFGKDPYYAAFESCIVGSLNGHRYNLAIHADLAEEYSEKCISLFHRIRARRPEAKSSVTGITFADDTVMPGLQMADMVSYCARVEAMGQQSAFPIIGRLIQLFHSQDHLDRTAFYLTSGNGLGEVEIE